VVWGLVVAACVGGVAASPVAAQTPDPEPLWNAYPLDDSDAGAAGTGQSAAGRQSGSTTPAASPAGATTTQARLTDEAGDGPPWLLMAAAAAGGALFVALLLVLQSRRARRRLPDLVVPAADEWPWLKSAPNGAAAREVRVERVKEPVSGTERQPFAPVGQPLEPTFEIAEAVAVPRHRFDREPPAPNGAAAHSRRGPICQVRWSRDDACFYALTTDAEGAEERVARSPSFEWDRAEPPDEESREARAALRVLSKELRDHGWRPMRVKGADFDEQRWYARRFRLPVGEPAAPSRQQA
jgi:hypothetical protein